jgi:hypothetical protein
VARQARAGYCWSISAGASRISAFAPIGSAKGRREFAHLNRANLSVLTNNRGASWFPSSSDRLEPNGRALRLM